MKLEISYSSSATDSSQSLETRVEVDCRASELETTGSSQSLETRVEVDCRASELETTGASELETTGSSQSLETRVEGAGLGAKASGPLCGPAGASPSPPSLLAA